MQQGSVIQSSRKACPDVWQFRWSERDQNGHRVYRKRVIGTVEQFVDAAAARHAAFGLIAEANLRSSKNRIGAITIDQLCEHFEQSEMRLGASRWSIATQRTYRGYIRRWIRPRWGSHCLEEVKAVEVEAWLGGLNLARGSRVKIRNVLFVLFNHACRHELFDRSGRRRDYSRRPPTPRGRAVRHPAVHETDWKRRWVSSNETSPMRSNQFLG
jgi:integrase